MPSTKASTASSFDEPAIKTLLATMGEACDVVRVVDPSTFEARTLNTDNMELNEPYRCHSAICKDRRCDNCISMRAIDEQRPVSKFEFVDGDAYFITARPIVMDGKQHTVEMVQKVSDDVGLGDNFSELQDQIQNDTRQEFKDMFTGTFTRRYFDEGLCAMNGRKLAIVNVDDPARINAKLGYPAGDEAMKRVAREILAKTRIEDSVIHYSASTFAIQFEDMDSDLFPRIVQRIYDALDTMTSKNYPSMCPMITIAAIDEDATNGELAKRAYNLLEEARRQGLRLIVHSEDSGYQAELAVRDAKASESLRHNDNRFIVDVDELTGLSSASAIRTHTQALVRERHEHAEGYCVVYFDIENFKQFNRIYGMQGGDILLKFVADRLRDTFPKGTAARLSSDIFVVVTNEDDIESRVKRVHAAVAGYQRKIALELKAGVSSIDEASHDQAAVIDLAKIACESVKGHYDQIVRFYDRELDQQISMNEYVVNNLDRAIEEGHIKVFFQPIIRAMTGHVCDYECLCRWDDPDHGLLPPSSFIGALERFHLINKVDACVVRQACQHQAALMAAGKPLVPVSVNLSRLDFQLEDIFETVERAVAEAGIPRSMLNIEVTESSLDDDAEHFAKELERFRSAGYEVWMDDFGSGYSSLNLLKDYRFDTLKIDMAFLVGFESNVKAREIIVTIVDMAKKLGIHTLIEGVETKEQCRFLQRIGCEMLQGYYFSKPRPYDDITESPFDLAVENAQERAYFDQIGSVNLLGLPSDEEAPESAEYVTESESRSTPMALVEYRNGEYHYLSANEPYLKRLETYGLAMLDDMLNNVPASGYAISDELAAQLDTSRKSTGETICLRELEEERVQMHVRHIATGPVANAFAVIPVTL